MNVIITDKIENSRDLMFSYLKKMENIQVLGAFDDFQFEFADLEQIDLIIFDITSANQEDMLSKIAKLKNKKPSIEFIATSYEINTELVSKTLKDGLVKDFLLKPLLPSVLEASIKKISDSKKENQDFAKTLCFFSNKAGTGKTSCAVNIAYEIAQKTQQKVCLLDLTHNDEDIATFLDIKLKFDINYILSKLENTDKDLFLSITNRYKNSKLYIVSFKEEFGTPSKINQKNIAKIINLLKNVFDWIIIDTQSPINENNLAIFSSCDLIFLICLLNLSSIRNSQKCMELFDKIGYDNDRIKLIINRYLENSDITIEDVEKTIGISVFNKIPNNYLTLIDAINLGQTLKEINPQSNIAKAYQNIVERI